MTPRYIQKGIIPLFILLLGLVFLAIYYRLEKTDSRPVDYQSLIPICVSWDQQYCGLINRRGKPVTPPVYQSLYNQPDIWIAERKDGTTDVLDLHGKLLGHMKDQNLHKLSDGVLVDFEKHFYHYDGTEINIENNQVTLVSTMSEGLIRAFGRDVHNELKDGYVDKNLKWIIPPTYDSVSDFHHGFAEVFVGDQDHRKIALIDNTGKMSTPLVPGTRIFWLYNDKWLRWVDDTTYSLIDAHGTILISNIATVDDENGERIVPYLQGERCGLLDLETLQKIPVVSENCNFPTGFSDSVIWISGKKGDNVWSPKSWLLINQQGKTLFEADVVNPQPFYRGFAVVEDRNDNYGVIDRNNRTILPLKYKTIDTPWLTWAQTKNYGDAWWLTEKDHPDVKQLMDSNGKLIAGVQQRVVQKKDAPCGNYTSGIDIVTDASGDRLWEEERLAACQR